MSTSFATTKLGLHLPIGTASVQGQGTSATPDYIICTDGDEVDLAVGDKCRLLASDFTLKSLSTGGKVVTITDIGAAAFGFRNISFTPAASANTVLGDILAKIEVVDVATAIGDQMATADTKFDCQVCTSGTRPGSPFTGQLIYETDTTNIMCWTGAAWRFVRPTNDKRPRRRVGYDTTTAASATLPNAGGGELTDPFLKIVGVQTLANHRYRFIVDVSVGSDTADWSPSEIRIRYKDGSTAPGNTDTLLDGRAVNRNSNGSSISNQCAFQEVFSFADSKVRSFGVFLQKPAGGGTLFFNSAHMHTFGMEDIGKPN